MPQTYDTGTLLEVRGERWLLAHTAVFESCRVLTLDGRDRDNANRRLRVIDPFDRPRRLSTGRLQRRSRQVVLRSALAAIAAARPAGGLWTAGAATIDLWPYQLEPALAAIGGATRLLLADAVGLGKTIQAGLLLAELGERGWVERTLIVCPAGLRDTWARELHDRFNLEASIVDQASLAERIATLPPGVNPWSAHGIAIASIDLVKRPEVIAALDGVPIDLLIADEAHHLAPGTDRGAAVARLASRIPWCVFASATPHSGDEAAFAYLTGLGQCGDAIAIFRRSRADVGLGTSRRSHLLRVHPTRDEAVLLDAIDRYARAIWHARGTEDRAVRLIAITMARRAASSRAAIEHTLVRRLALLATTPSEPAQPRLPWDEEDSADDVEDQSVLSAPGLASIDDERRAIGELIDLARRCGGGSKMRRIVRFLSRSREPAIVFTEYRHTLEAVVAALTQCRRVAAIHGGLPLELRRAAVDAFTGGRVDVLVATDAAGEGLNLHHRCRLVIDVELPWNPLRLEQRIGRVDRLGQRRPVHAVRLFHPRSIEQQVLDHLQLRRRRAEVALDRSPISEHAIAAAIFDGAPIERRSVPHIRGDRVRAAVTEARRLDDQRRARRLSAPEPAGPLWTPPRTRRSDRLVLLHRVTFVSGRGLLVGGYLDARAVAVPATRHRREWRQLIERTWSSLRPSSENEAERQRTQIVRALALSQDGVNRRLQLIRSRLGGLRATEHQASLFDRRAEQRAVQREHDASVLDAALLDTERRVVSPIDAEGVRVELVAAWPERGR
jgi:superfamily II DNA or RNA helicase